MRHNTEKTTTALAQLKRAVSITATLRICLHALATQEANAVDAFHLWQVCELLEVELSQCEESFELSAQ